MCDEVAQSSVQLIRLLSIVNGHDKQVHKPAGSAVLIIQRQL